MGCVKYNCNVESGLVVYGIIQAVLSGLFALGFATMLGYFTIWCIATLTWPDSIMGLLIFGSLVVVITFWVTSFLFSMMLIHGIRKRRPNQVLAYFIFGTIAGLLLLIVSVVCLTINDVLPYGVIALIVSLIHLLPLFFVHKTYRKLKSFSNYKQCGQEILYKIKDSLDCGDDKQTVYIVA